MQKLSPSTIGILKACVNGACIRWEIVPVEQTVFVLGAPTTVTKRVRRLTILGGSINWSMLEYLLNKAFDILAARGYIRRTLPFHDGSRNYVPTVAGQKFLKGLAI